ncbi:hypothetical protein BBJ28_00014416 [Nothophytophthora sp. Chile5]|nr:hypothetical protein BBJ28_00014416 [Nothophytophthora sp. Chile5]
MKTFSVGLALCAALAITTDLAVPVAAKGTICKTSSGFTDSSGSSSTPTATIATTTTTSSTTGTTTSSSTVSDASATQDDDDDAEYGSTSTADASSGTTTADNESSTEGDAGDVSVGDDASSAGDDADVDASTAGDEGDVSVGDDSQVTSAPSSSSNVGQYQQSDGSTESEASSSSSSSSSVSTSFTKVTALQARVQGDMPQWNEDNQRFVSKYYDTFEEKYQAVLDTVNMAAVEGALKYVQAECINSSVVTDCERKNSVKYVVFYETTVVQPVAAMEYYANATDDYDFAIEHCPFMAMDGGQCDPNEDGSFPDVCNQYIGADGQPELGFCIGGTLQDNEVIAPYPNNYWFSFPNSCPQDLWDDKTSSCREEYAGGMCALGVEPDGVNCSFTYEILGYILLDDVVGITSMINPLTLDYYADYYEFCEAGGIELSVSVLGDLVTWLGGLAFWENPGDSAANAERAVKLVSAYEELVAANSTTSDGGVMQALPTVASLTALNPPCYENSAICAEAEYGCKRSLYSQMCEVCTSSDSDCVVKA